MDWSVPTSQAAPDKVGDHQQCEQCDYRSPHRGGLLSHVSAVHEKVKTHACAECDFRCTRSSDLKASVNTIKSKTI